MTESKPKIFVSSTIYDFADLRSALKYWLSEMGFEVFMSEYNDFRKDSSKNSYNACLNAIKECDYYILLIGSRVGGLYSNDPKISITQKEYQEASRLFNEGSIKKIFTFVRKDIWTIREDRKALYQYLKENYAKEKELSDADLEIIKYHQSKYVNDGDFIFNFINEVSKVAQMKDALSGESDLPINNWINTFSSFEDIITVLKIELNIQSELSFRRWSELIAQEISYNVSKLCFKKEGVYYPYYEYLSDFRKIFPKTINTAFTIDKKLSLRILKFYSSSGIHANWLKCDILKGALQSGVFLKYDKNKSDYCSSNIQKALYDLIDNISKTQRLYQLMDNSKTISRIVPLIQENEFTINCNSRDMDLFCLAALYNSEYNIISLSHYLWYVLKFDGDAMLYPKLQPTRMVFQEENKYEELTSKEIYDFFSKRVDNSEEK